MRNFLYISVLFLLALAFPARAEMTPADADRVKEGIASEFVKQGIADQVEIEVYGGKSFPLSCEAEYKMMVSNLKVDKAQNKFSCLVEFFAEGQETESSEIQGKFYEVADAYVPAANIAKGGVITEKMLRQTVVRTTQIKPQNIIDLDKIAGKEAKRALKAGKLISEGDIGAKALIKKGDIVNMVYLTKNMQISAKVTALSDGGQGEKIQVMNVKSKKVLDADVVDEKTVKAETDF